MTTIHSFLTCEVQRKTMSPIEQTANFLLTPARYLLNGKRVELFQRGEEKALLLSPSFVDEERSWIKSTFMVACLLPGVLIGAIFKFVASPRENDSFVQERLPAQVLWRQVHGDQALANAVDELTNNLLLLQHNKKLQLKAPSFIANVAHRVFGTTPYQRSSPFFIKEITLFDECVSAAGRDFAKKTDSFMANNNLILKNVDLLYHLESIHLQDHYIGTTLNDAEQALERQRLEERPELFIKAFKENSSGNGGAAITLIRAKACEFFSAYFPATQA